MALIDLVGELTGVIPGLSPILAQTYINRAYQEIRNQRNWSFLVTDGVVVCPGVVTDGSVNVTQYLATVTLDVDASAALLPQTVVGSVPGLLQLQIRFGSTPIASQIYSIVAFDITTPTAIILTLDRPVVEGTNAASPYQCYRCYVIPPIPDFKTWVALTDYTNSFSLTGNRLNGTSAQFDLRDPQRSSQGLAYWLGAWGGNRTGNPITGATVPNATVDASVPVYELWPHPTQGQVFYARFRRKGDPLINPSDELPEQIPDELVMSRALGWHGYPWAQANVGHYPMLKGANWPTLMMQARRSYAELLLDAKRNDNEQQLQDVWSRGHGLRTRRWDFKGVGDYPIDADFLQSHLVRF